MPPRPATSFTAGPLCHATLLVREAAPVVAAYAAIGLVPGAAVTISPAQARAWGVPGLAGCAMTGLGVPGATRAAESFSQPVQHGQQGPAGPAGLLLRVIEHADARPRPTRFSHGWMALEILVRDVDALARRLPAVGFEVVGPPADLDVSPNIRAMQVVGPAGEMLYLTQVKAAVPPFQIPLSGALPATQPFGPLFIAVMSTPSRADALAACAVLAPLQTLQFDTRITVLNRALGHDAQARWPVATVQFGGQCLFEIDEVRDPQVGAPPQGTPMSLPHGLAWVTMRTHEPVASVASAASAVSAASAASAALLELSPGAWLERLAC